MEGIPLPFVPADVDLRDFGFMPLDVVRLRDSGLTAKATGDEFRAAVLLWCASWHQQPAASLPDDDRELANLCGYGRAQKEWKKVRDGALHGFVKCSDGRMYHPMVAEKAIEAWRSKQAQRARTEAARKAREDARQKLQHDQLQPLSQTKSTSVTDLVTESKGQGQGQGYVNLTDACASDPAISPQFSRFWDAWPKSQRKVDKAKCSKAWVKHRLDALADAVVSHVEAMKQTQQWRDGFEPAPLTYLNGKRWLDEVQEVSGYDSAELSVIEAYNAAMPQAGWPDAAVSPYSQDRAAAIREFLTFGQKPDWLARYIDWMLTNIPAKPGCGFDWFIRRDIFLRAREGNFSALQA